MSIHMVFMTLYLHVLTGMPVIEITPDDTIKTDLATANFGSRRMQDYFAPDVLWCSRSNFTEDMARSTRASGSCRYWDLRVICPYVSVKSRD